MSTESNGRTGAPRGNKNSRTHGLHSMRSALKELGSRAIDKRTATGKALAAWQGEIIQDLGGPDALSTQQLAILDLAVKTKLLVDSVDAWLLSQRSIVNTRKRALIPAIGQRVQLADSLSRYLGQLGLEKRQPPAPNLQDYLRQRAAEKAQGAAAEKAKETPSGSAAASPASGNEQEPASSQASLDAETPAGENGLGRERQPRAGDGRYLPADSEQAGESEGTP